MAVITTQKTENFSKYYLLHCIEGINIVLIKESLIETYIDKNPLQYRLYIECNSEVELLDNHPHLQNTVEGKGGSIIYVFEIPDEFKKNYRRFRDNKVSEFDGAFVNRIITLSGLNYGKKINGTNMYNVMLLRVDKKQHNFYTHCMIEEFRNNDWFDDFMEIPCVASNSIITTWDEWEELCEKIKSGEENMSVMKKIITPNYKLVEVTDNEFIENYW